MGDFKMLRSAGLSFKNMLRWALKRNANVYTIIAPAKGRRV